MKLIRIGKWQFDLSLHGFVLPAYFIYDKSFKFILADIYITDFSGWITFCNIRLKWQKYFKKEKR